MMQKWHYLVADKETHEFYSNYLDSELSASSICSNLESFGYEVIVLEKAKTLPIINFLQNPLKNFYAMA